MQRPVARQHRSKRRSSRAGSSSDGATPGSAGEEPPAKRPRRSCQLRELLQRAEAALAGKPVHVVEVTQAGLKAVNKLLQDPKFRCAAPPAPPGWPAAHV